MQIDTLDVYFNNVLSILGKIMRRRLKIKQHDQNDCGAACLASIGISYGVKLPLARIKEYCGCSIEGISIKGIIEGASKMGLRARGLKSPEKEITQLIEIDAPIIAHLITTEGLLHFVVIYKISKDFLLIMDPAYGEFKKVAYSSFLSEWSGLIIVVTPGNNFIQKDETTPLLLRLLALISFHKREIALIICGSIALIFIGIGNSILLQYIIDSVIPANNYNLFICISIILTLFLISALHIGYTRALILLKCNLKIDIKLITGYLDKLFNLPLSFFNNYQTGDINSRVGDAFKIRGFISEGLVSGLVSILTVIGVLVAMIIYNTQIGFAVMCIIPIYVSLFAVSAQINRKYSRKLAKLGATFESQIINNISGIKSIKHYDSQDFVAAKIERSYSNLIWEMDMASTAMIRLKTLGDAVSKMVTILMLIYGTYLVLRESISLGEMISLYTLSSYLITPLNTLVNMNRSFSEAIVAGERLFEIMDMESEEDGNFGSEGVVTYPLSKIDKLSIKGLKFHYPGRSSLFENLSITFNPGEITSIWGASGCGKSSLGSLIIRDIAPLEGGIFFNETNIKNIGYDQLRTLVSIVPQRAQLIEGTILENITSGKSDISIDYIYSLCNSLNLTNLIERLPLGILSNAGLEGGALSGGEIQKIAIARALYRDPQIIIFDEATSFLDKDSESAVLNIMKELKKRDKIVIMITHNMENLKYADKIIDLSAHSEWEPT